MFEASCCLNNRSFKYLILRAACHFYDFTLWYVIFLSPNDFSIISRWLIISGRSVGRQKKSWSFRVLSADVWIKKIRWAQIIFLCNFLQETDPHISWFCPPDYKARRQFLIQNVPKRELPRVSVPLWGFGHAFSWLETHTGCTRWLSWHVKALVLSSKSKGLKDTSGDKYVETCTNKSALHIYDICSGYAKKPQLKSVFCHILNLFCSFSLSLNPIQIQFKGLYWHGKQM